MTNILKLAFALFLLYEGAVTVLSLGVL